MCTSSDRREARKKALRLLEHMDRTEKGLMEKLKKAGFTQEAAEDAVTYVKSFGYLNDLRYASYYISARIHSKSRQKIFQELLGKGVGLSTIQAAWEEQEELEEPDERTIIKKEIEKKYQPGILLEEKQMRRLYGYLARRGFKSGDIFSVLEELHITWEPKTEDL